MQDAEEPIESLFEAPPMAEQERMCEAVLFASAEPVSVRDLEARMPHGADVPQALELLRKRYEGRGVRVVRVNDTWAIRTAPDLGFLMQKETVETRKLSRAAIETLAIIAYHQPATRAEIEEIRRQTVTTRKFPHPRAGHPIRHQQVAVGREPTALGFPGRGGAIVDRDSREIGGIYSRDDPVGRIARIQIALRADHEIFVCGSDLTVDDRDLWISAEGQIDLEDLLTVSVGHIDERRDAASRAANVSRLYGERRASCSEQNDHQIHE